MTLARTKIRIRRLRRSELPVDTVELARFLIGKTLVHDLPHVRLSGRIVETEAYLVGDAACHAFRGVTPRNRALFLERGHAYVYFIYGNHFMLNVSGQREGIGEGILLRGLEPLEGIDWMQLHRAEKPSRRGRGNRSADSACKKSTAPLTELSRGPGRLAAALRITRSLDGWTCVRKVRSGWVPRRNLRGKLESACALESGWRLTGFFAFTSAAMHLSAVLAGSIPEGDLVPIRRENGVLHF